MSKLTFSHTFDIGMTVPLSKPDYLKVVSAIFLYFIKRKYLKKYEKCFLPHLKSSFRSRDIPIIVFFLLLVQIFKMQRVSGKWNNYDVMI